MPSPPLDDQQTAQALEAYYANRESMVRSVLYVLDPTAVDAPARPYPDVLARVYELIAAEMRRYSAPAETPPPAEPPQEEPHA